MKPVSKQSVSKTAAVRASVQPPAATPPTAPRTPAQSTAMELFKGDATKLSARQQSALVAIANGLRFGEAARVAGVNRKTLHDWRTQDPHFIAALNSWQGEVTASAVNRLLQLSDDAVTTVGDAIIGGDVRAALEILRRMGILSPPKIGSGDPTEVLREIQTTKKEQASRAAHREQNLKMDATLAKMLG